ncbi:hypothetical protein HPB52_018461 [Rhipicephalus sanguineus]|uniref:Uncharacterized protein n=1 Tax=Rhipicephalus sanguineus TaxID=34632 RepID=A0A9D4Q2L9_RHISA|nr:hypothetical protein HPB52_018461 [Rhipicephalus sanguineus]
MQQVIATFLLLSVFLITAPAYKLPEDDFTVEAAFGVSSREAAEEAILVGHILRIAASELEKDDTEDNEVDEYSFRTFWAKLKEATDADEYFFRSLWENIIGAIKKAAQAIWNFIKELAKDIKDATKEVGIAVLQSAGDTLREKATEKALAIVSKIFDNGSVTTYSSDKYHSNTDVVKDISARMDLVGKHLIEQGNAILAR